MCVYTSVFFYFLGFFFWVFFFFSALALNCPAERVGQTSQNRHCPPETVKGGGGGFAMLQAKSWEGFFQGGSLDNPNVMEPLVLGSPEFERLGIHQLPVRNGRPRGIQSLETLRAIGVPMI